jgi:hypothetical protein
LRYFDLSEPSINSSLDGKSDKSNSLKAEDKSDVVALLKLAVECSDTTYSASTGGEETIKSPFSKSPTPTTTTTLSYSPKNNNNNANSIIPSLPKINFSSHEKKTGIPMSKSMVVSLPSYIDHPKFLVPANDKNNKNNKSAGQKMLGLESRSGKEFD